MSSAKCFYGAAAGYDAAFVSLFYCSYILFLLFAVTAPVKLVLLRIVLGLLFYLLPFCSGTFSFVKFLLSP